MYRTLYYDGYPDRHCTLEISNLLVTSHIVAMNIIAGVEMRVIVLNMQIIHSSKVLD